MCRRASAASNVLSKHTMSWPDISTAEERDTRLSVHTLIVLWATNTLMCAHKGKQYAAVQAQTFPNVYFPFVLRLQRQPAPPFLFPVYQFRAAEPPRCHKRAVLWHNKDFLLLIGGIAKYKNYHISKSQVAPVRWVFCFTKSSNDCIHLHRMAAIVSQFSNIRIKSEKFVTHQMIDCFLAVRLLTKTSSSAASPAPPVTFENPQLPTN